MAEDAAQEALYLIFLLEREISSTAAPWREPQVDQEAYGGGIILSWDHGYRRMRIYSDCEGMQLFVVDSYGIIKEVDNFGIRELRELWHWFWDSTARWTHIWPTPK